MAAHLCSGIVLIKDVVHINDVAAGSLPGALRLIPRQGPHPNMYTAGIGTNHQVNGRMFRVSAVARPDAQTCSLGDL